MSLRNKTSQNVLVICFLVLGFANVLNAYRRLSKSHEQFNAFLEAFGKGRVLKKAEYYRKFKIFQVKILKLSQETTNKPLQRSLKTIDRLNEVHVEEGGAIFGVTAFADQSQASLYSKMLSKNADFLEENVKEIQTIMKDLKIDANKTIPEKVDW